MRKKEIKFTKYQSQSADYHYQAINHWNILQFNLFLYTRYLFAVNEVIKHIKSIKEKTPTLKILDIGCGDGVLLYMLQEKLNERKIEIYGIDSSTEALNVAREKILDGRFTKGDAYRTGLRSDFFDVVISSDVIEHLQSPKDLLHEMKRVAKRDAFVLVATPVRITEEPEGFHVHEFFPNELKSLIGDFFGQSRVMQTHPLFWFLLYEKVIHIGRFYFSFCRYFINLAYLIFQINPFAITDTDAKEKFSYIFATGIKS